MRFLKCIPVLPCLLFMCFYTNAPAQNPVGVDSLQRELDKLSTKTGYSADTARVNLLNSIAGKWLTNVPAKAQTYSDQALAIAKKLGYTKGIAQAYTLISNIKDQVAEKELALKYSLAANELWRSINDLGGLERSLSNTGTIYEHMDSLDMALKYFDSSLNCRPIPVDNKNRAAVYGNIGVYYLDLGKYDSTIKYQQLAYAIQKKINDERGMAIASINTGIAYKYQGNFSPALRHFFEAQRLAEKIKNDMILAASYQFIGEMYAEVNNLEQSLRYFNLALKLFEQISAKSKMAMLNIKIGGSLYEPQHEYEKALAYYKRAHDLFADIKDDYRTANTDALIAYMQFKLKRLNYDTVAALFKATLQQAIEKDYKLDIVNAYSSLADMTIDIRNFPLAREYYSKALDLSRGIRSRTTIVSCYLGLSRCDSALGNLESSFNNYKQYILYRDSLTREEAGKLLAERSIAAEFEEKAAVQRAEQEKKDLVVKAAFRRQQLIRNSIGAGLAAVALFSFVVFRQRNRISKEKQKSEHLLLNIFPADTAHELKTTGAAAARNYDNVTVMFTDFKNFTNVSEQLTAQQLVDQIHFCYSEFDNITHRYGIEKIKTIGDSYMCAAGIPDPGRSGAKEAVQAALEICAFIQREKAAHDLEGKPFPDIRIGLHTGPVVAGIVGKRKFAYDIWGDTVNIASRLESSGKVGKVNISETTYQLVKDHFNCVARGKIAAKNKGEIEMYFVEGMARK